jgi:hypothetical protein
MVDHSPLAIVEDEWLKVLDSHFLVVFVRLNLTAVVDLRDSKFGALDECHFVIDLHRPVSKGLDSVNQSKLSYKFQNLFLSFLGSGDFVRLDLPHLKRVLGEVDWKRCFMAQLSRQVSLLTLFSVNVEHGLLLSQRNFVNIIEILSD